MAEPLDRMRGVNDGPGLTGRQIGGSDLVNGGNNFFQEPVAIVGMACRLPGNITTPSEFWDLLMKEESGQCEVPLSRFNAKSFYHPNSTVAGCVNGPGGYFIKEDIRAFENSFFGINNLEAQHMDPQQRKLLEVVFECFESAGLTLNAASDADIGVFVANFTVDYSHMLSKDPETYHRFSSTGSGTPILANRISHVFNLKGPSCVLDTACSSSLYSLHQACSALQARECDGAIVAGANLIQSTEMHINSTKAGVISGTSTCHTFDISADGYGRAEGVDALYIKRLSDALRDGDHIRAIIRGVAVNSNGKTNGISLPSSAGQAAVIRKAYNKAGLTPDATQYIEAHGTGTPIGDPIEVDALSQVFQDESDRPLLIGSVKTNLGHGEGVSGITSIIKVALALEKGIIPPTIGIKELNPALKLAERNVSVVQNVTPWPKSESSIRRAGVNSFGYGGANAHAILEAYDDQKHMQMCNGTSQNKRQTFLLPFSAHTKESLISRVDDLDLSSMADVPLVDIAHTLSSHRSKFSSRGFLLAHSTQLSEGLSSKNLRTLPVEGTSRQLPFVFVFTGQGAQWAGMGRSLIEEFPRFRKTIEELDAVLSRLSDAPSWSISGAMKEPAESSKINLSSHSQPINTALQIALVDLLREWNILPDIVIGHSSGEIAAAYAAGHLKASEAIILAYYRGLVVFKSPTKGAMIAAGLDADSARESIAKHGMEGRVQVACINSPQSVTISGDFEDINQLQASLSSEGKFARLLRTDGKAYHSHHMALLGQEYEDCMRNTFKESWKGSAPPSIKMISTVTGKPIDPSMSRSPGYWRENLVSPVLFSAAVSLAMSGTAHRYIEIGPHAALGLPIKDIRTKLELDGESMPYSSTIIRNSDSVTELLSLAGTLFLHGHDVNFDKVNESTDVDKNTSSLRNVSYKLPKYRWHYEPAILNEPRISIEYRTRTHPRHELLGSRTPGGNGYTILFKNMLHLKDIPWLVDHKLGSTVVYPGACYIAMAVEALLQAYSTEASERCAITLLQMKIVAVLNLTELHDGVELLTQIRPNDTLLNPVSLSTWWEFIISSVSKGTSTIHARGLIGYGNSEHSPNSILPAPVDQSEKQASKSWYDKFASEGLNFGPAFQSVSEICHDTRHDTKRTISQTRFLQGGLKSGGYQSKYLIHPIAIDAMLQSGIIADTAGIIEELRAKVPVAIGYMRFDRKHGAKVFEVCTVNATSESTGFSSISINAELGTADGELIVQMRDVRATSYEDSIIREEPERFPMLKLVWKPDITRIRSHQLVNLTKYLDESPSVRHHKRKDVTALGSILDLFAHQNPGLRILELGSQDRAVNDDFLDILRQGLALKRFQTYKRASLDANGLLIDLEAETNDDLLAQKSNSISSGLTNFDIIILLLEHTAEAVLASNIEAACKYLSDSGTVIFLTKSQIQPSLALDSLSFLSAKLRDNSMVHIARFSNQDKIKRLPLRQPVVLVESNKKHPFNNALHTSLSKLFDEPVMRLSLDELSELSIPQKAIVVTTIELEKPLLIKTTPQEFNLVKLITDNASTLLWITGGNLHQAQGSDFAPVFGLSRALMLEQPSLKFLVLDINPRQEELIAAIGNVEGILELSLQGLNKDMEFRQHDGLLYTCRFTPDQDMNLSVRQKQNSEPVSVPLKESRRFRLALKNPGQIDTLHFAPAKETANSLKPNFVEVEIKSVGLNAKDIHILGDRIDTKDATCAFEFSGTITRTGCSVSEFAPGDRVVVMAPNRFGAYECVPEWACCKLLDSEEFTSMSTLPVVFSSAIYALKYRAQLQPGETVLIHSAAGGLGIAAIQIARLYSAEIFATVGSDSKKQFLIETYGLQPDHIFNSRDSGFLTGIMDLTAGKGVDVVLNSLTGNLLQDSWRACAEFGRFVEVGKRDIIDGANLDMNMFLKSVTFTAFDLASLFWSPLEVHNMTWRGLIHESVELLRNGNIQAVSPCQVFDISDLVQAYRYFSLPTRIGKVAVSLENPESLIKIVRPKHEYSFSADKEYFLVGCLGGLGRSLSKWMLDRGARKFTFFGRSGLEKAAARELVEDLRQNGATVQVIRGSIADSFDVLNAISQIQHPIGGVINAAMGLEESLFSSMTNSGWHTSIDPKVHGTWNLHNALQGHDSQLDFFLLTSSMNGSVGTATESNYCAANSFLDAFARYRRSLGLPALSLGLGMISDVGYLAEHPEIGALLLRKGVHPISQKEMLQIVDIALCAERDERASQSNSATSTGSFDDAHILTGLEIIGLQKQREQGFEGKSYILEDPRASILTQAFESTSSTIADNDKSNWHLSSPFLEALKTGNKPLLSAAVLQIVMEKMGNLLLLPIEKLSAGTKLADFGMDSMLSAEFRTFIFHTFEVEVPFLTLLGKLTTIESLAEIVVVELFGMKVK